MASINFLYRSTKETATLNLRLLFRNKDKDIVLGGKTKVLVTKQYWTKEHNLTRGKTVEILNKQNEIKKELEKIESYLLSAFNEANPDNVDANWLNTQMEYYYNPQKQVKHSDELIVYFDTYLKLKSSDLEENTKKKCNVIKKLLTRYQAHLGQRLLIKNIDETFKSNFEVYCKDKGYAKNTFVVALKYIKTVCNHAKDNGVEVSKNLKKVSAKYEKVNSVYLSLDDIDAIEKTEGLTEYLDNARDWLIISCFTGQRVSDFMTFRSSMIREEKDSKGQIFRLIEFTQTKTKQFISLPLHPKVVEILDKRNGEFPRAISDVNYNLYIKKVAKKAKLNEEVIGSKYDKKKKRKVKKLYPKYDLVTSHIGRRSFATNFYGDIPTPLLMSATGHTTEKVFLNYIGKGQTDRAKSLANYFN